MAEHPQATVRALGRQLERELDQLVTAMLARLLAEPDLRHYDEPHFRELAAQIARENLRHEIRALASDLALPESCPPEAALAARQAVELDAPVTVVLQCYRAGHAVLWRSWLRLVDGVDPSTPELRTHLLETGSDFMFAYVERCSTFVIDEYNRYREEAIRSRDHDRLRAVQQILAGNPGAEDRLGYSLESRHLGLVAWGPGAEPLLRRIASAIGGASLVLPGGDGTIWAWVDCHRGDFRQVVAAAEVPSATALACGTPATGREGFARAHREAQDARAVGLRRGAELTFYDDVALEALALVAEPRARDFVAMEIGPLLDGTRRSARLLTTLKAYFASLQNAAAAAARLGVNERTVRNRLSTVEEVLGYHPADRRLELEAALRLSELLSSGEPPADSSTDLKDVGRR